MLTLRQMDSIVHNTLLIFKGFEINRREEGTNIFYDIHDGHESGNRFLGTYRVWEWHDGSGRSGWVNFETDDTEIIRIRQMVWEAIMAIAIPANQSTEHNTEKSIKIDKENITLGELEERVQAEDREAIEFWEKEVNPIFEKMSQAFLAYADTLFEHHPSKPFLETIKSMSRSSNPVHRAIAKSFGNWSLQKIQDRGAELIAEELAKSANELPNTIQVDSENTKPKLSPRIPKQAKRLNEWKAAWRKVKGRWKNGDVSYAELAKIAKLSSETIADIVKAGDAGLLD